MLRYSAACAISSQIRRCGSTGPLPSGAAPPRSPAAPPDVFELSSGDFAIIGTDATEELDRLLPQDAGRADYERIVVVSRETLVAARRDIPEV
jgi:hypothetical protein